MTIDKFNIQSIAVIGGGPGGIATVHELLHTTKEGSSTVGAKDYPLESQRAFPKVVGFEQKDKLGGTWAPSVDKPDIIENEIWKSDYHDPDVIHPKVKIPESVNEHTVDNPLVTDGVKNDDQWRRSAVYPGLYTNVPRRFLRFSTIEYNEPEKKSAIDPLITYQEVGEVLDKFVGEKKLNDHFRLNTQVEKVEKNSEGKWVLTLRHSTNKGKDEWYQETFDAIAVASGHYSVPFIPYIKD